MAPPPGPDLSHDRQVLEHAYRNLGPMIGVGQAAVIGVGFVVGWSNPVVAAWIGLHSVLMLVRAVSWLAFGRFYRGKHDRLGIKGWQVVYAAGLWASGLMWATLGLYSVVAGASTGHFVHDFGVLIVLSGLAGGASGVTSPFRRIGMTYISLLLLPTATALLFKGGDATTLGGLGLLFWMTMLGSLHMNNKVLLRGLYLTETNLTLVRELSAINVDLESKVAERTAQLETLAHTDGLTGLLNRHGLAHWWRGYRALEPERSLVVFFLDLDRFKNINDALGHDVGDRVLLTIAHKLQSVLPAEARLARWGGDEFVLVWPYDGKPDELVGRAWKDLSEAVGLPLVINGVNLKVGISIGWSCCPGGDPSLSDAIHAADLAASEVKRTGRGRAMAYSETHSETLRRHFDLGRALGDAIGTDAIQLVYQPVVSAQTGEIIAEEALCRWNHPQLGPIRPDEFIHIAEETDRIVALGRWILRQACQDAQRWRQAGLDRKVAVNVSMRQLVESTFQHDLVAILAETGLPGQHLEIEVTESVFDDEHIDLIARTLDDLKILGVSVQIDDFGTGYSSLSRLRRLTIDAIKIDRSFVAELNSQNRVIVESTVMIARAFGLRVIAEGVERPDQAAELRALGIDMLQGYMFGRPRALGDEHGVRPAKVA